MLAGVASGGVYKSTDGGATWKPPAPGNGMVRSETVWSITESIPGITFAATQSGMYRSTDFGSTWTLRNDGITGTVLRVFKDENAPNIYYAAGTDGVFRTVNGGVTWSKINIGPNSPSGTIRAMKQLSGVDLTRLYVGTPDGVYAGTTDHAPCPARSSGARSPTTASATTRSSGRCRTSSRRPARCSPARSPTAATC